MAVLKERFFSEAISSIPSSFRPLKILIAHATPSLLCNNDQFSEYNCVQMHVDTFWNRTTSPYLFDVPSHDFDVVILQGILDNALEVSRVIFEAQRILQPCGKLIFDATSRNLATWIRLVIFERILRLEPWHHRNWRLFVQSDEMMRVLTAYNFSSFQTASFSSSIDWSRLLAGNPILDSIDIESTSGEGQEYTIAAINKGCSDSFQTTP